MRRDPLSVFYTWPIKVRRKAGQTGKGVTYEDEDTSIKAKIRLVSQLVTTTDGDEVTSVATVTMSSTTRHIPVGSQVILPVELMSNPDGSEVVCTVEVQGPHDSGIKGVPAFYQVALS